MLILFGINNVNLYFNSQGVLCATALENEYKCICTSLSQGDAQYTVILIALAVIAVTNCIKNASCYFLLHTCSLLARSDALVDCNQTDRFNIFGLVGGSTSLN